LLTSHLPPPLLPPLCLYSPNLSSIDSTRSPSILQWCLQEIGVGRLFWELLTNHYILSEVGCNSSWLYHLMQTIELIKIPFIKK
jgi:hypothetical protein